MSVWIASACHTEWPNAIHTGHSVCGMAFTCGKIANTNPGLDQAEGRMKVLAAPTCFWLLLLDFVCAYWALLKFPEGGKFASLQIIRVFFLELCVYIYMYIYIYTYIYMYVYISVWKWVIQLCPTLYDSEDYTVHGILQARILEWVAFLSLLQGSSQPRDQTQVSHIARRFFMSWATREAPYMYVCVYILIYIHMILRLTIGEKF